jgi:hypothetical protein
MKFGGIGLGTALLETLRLRLGFDLLLHRRSISLLNLAIAIEMFLL